jgi:hypothetical protein
VKANLLNGNGRAQLPAPAASTRQANNKAFVLGQLFLVLNYRPRQLQQEWAI